MQNHKIVQHSDHTKDGKKPEQPTSGNLHPTHLQNKNFVQNIGGFPQSAEKDGN